MNSVQKVKRAMEKDRVKPCPFCGGRIKAIKSFTGMLLFQCRGECGCIVSFNTAECNDHPEKAIKAFNRRVSHDERRNAPVC